MQREYQHIRGNLLNGRFNNKMEHLDIIFKWHQYTPRAIFTHHTMLLIQNGILISHICIRRLHAVVWMHVNTRTISIGQQKDF